MAGMEPVISVFFDSDHTYVALLEPDAKGYSLAYINSTRQSVDLTDGGEAMGGISAVVELHEVFMEIAGASSVANVTLPMESVFVHQFPAPLELSEQQITELVRFEISQHFPNQDADAFTSVVYPMCPRLDGTRMMMAVIMERSVIRLVHELLQPLGAEISRIDVAQIAAHNTLAYNYPDNEGSSFIVFGVQERYIDVSVIKNNELCYYQLTPLADRSQIGEVCEEQLARVLDEYVPFVDGAFLFGSGLTQEMFTAVQRKMTIPAVRLNAFRMVSTTLGDRERAYCTRVAHIFPPCLGSVLPELGKGIKL
jgi:hypothetical protein